MWTPWYWLAEGIGWQTDGHTRDLEIPAPGGQAKEGIAVVRDARVYSPHTDGLGRPGGRGLSEGKGPGPLPTPASRLSEPPALTWEGRSICSLTRVLGDSKASVCELDFGVAALNTSLPRQAAVSSICG